MIKDMFFDNIFEVSTIGARFRVNCIDYGTDVWLLHKELVCLHHILEGFQEGLILDRVATVILII